MSELKKFNLAKQRRKQRSRYKVLSRNKSKRMRVSFFESNANLYVQLVNDFEGITITSVSSCEKQFKDMKNINSNNIKELAVAFSERCKNSGILTCVFDKGHRKFIGKVKVFVDTMVENGIKI